MNDAIAFLNVFGNAIWIAFAAGMLWAGIRYRFNRLEERMAVHARDNAKEHDEMKKDLADHEGRLRRYEWSRPGREER